MISTITRRFTKRFQVVNVLTLSSLREHLESISTPDRKFRIENAGRDRVTVRVETGNGQHAAVVFPAYPTGHPDDQPTNPNVVLDPLEFVKAETHAQREAFLPLLDHDILAHYEKMHPSAVMPFNRCC